MVTQADIARHAGVDLSTVNRILNRRGAHTFREQTVRRVLDVAGRLGFNLGRLRYFHRRRASRLPVSMNCELHVYRDDGTQYDHGKCSISDLSQFGALVSGVALGRESLPTGEVTILLLTLDGPLQGLELRARIVRYQRKESAGYGVEFIKLRPDVCSKLARLLAEKNDGQVRRLNAKNRARLVCRDKDSNQTALPDSAR